MKRLAAAWSICVRAEGLVNIRAEVWYSGTYVLEALPHFLSFQSTSVHGPTCYLCDECAMETDKIDTYQFTDNRMDFWINPS